MPAWPREAGGRLLLRIEDIDATRCRPEYEAAIFEDLRWLGLAWEEPVRRQSQHLGAYAEALERLAARGLIYPSFESRAEIAALVAARERDGPWPRDPDGAPLYPGTAKALPPKERDRRMAAGDPYALRLDMAAALAVAGSATARLERDRRRPGRRNRPDSRRPGPMGRCRAGPQGYSDELPPRRGGRRCPPGHHPCGARAGPVRGHEPAPAACRFSSYFRSRSIIIIA